MIKTLHNVKIACSPLTGKIFMYRHGIDPTTVLEKREAEADVMAALVEHMMFDMPKGAEKDVVIRGNKYTVRVTEDSDAELGDIKRAAERDEAMYLSVLREQEGSGK